jgi:hypothetical protein
MGHFPLGARARLPEQPSGPLFFGFESIKRASIHATQSVEGGVSTQSVGHADVETRTSNSELLPGWGAQFSLAVFGV